jgi:hypothetical protein
MAGAHFKHMSTLLCSDVCVCVLLCVLGLYVQQFHSCVCVRKQIARLTNNISFYCCGRNKKVDHIGRREHRNERIEIGGDRRV